MGGDLFGVGMSGLMAYRNALNSTFNNIVNAANPGYNRQTVDFNSRPMQGAISGGGVDVKQMNRMYNDYLTIDLRNTITAYEEMNSYYGQASGLDTFLGNESSSVAKGLESYFSSLHNLISDPASLTAREVYLNQSSGLVSRFHGVNDELNRQYSDLNQQLQSTAEEVTNIAANIAEVNGRIMGAERIDPMLLDKRDDMMKELAEYISVSTVARDDGAIDIFMGNGDALVLGGNSATISTTQDPLDPSRLEITMKTDYSDNIISDNISGGKLGGLLAFRDEVLDPAINEVNRLALSISASVNDQHKKGMDLNNNLGGNFFTDVNAASAVSTRVISSSENTGSGTFSVTIDDVGALEASDYRLKFTSANDYTLVRSSDNVAVSSGTIAGYPETIAVDGFTMQITAGSFSANDIFTVSPTRNAARTMNVEIDNASQIALASPVQASTSTNNTGNGVISLEEITDISNPSFATPGQLSPPIRVEFLSDTSYQLVNATTSAVIEGPISYTPGSNNNLFPTPGSFDPGYRVSITGAPAAGDTYTLNYNAGARGDSSNGLFLADLQNIKILDGGTTTFQENYNTFSSSVSSRTHFADLQRQSKEILMETAQSRRDEVSGVNLEEEAANLMYYQQAYQASAQLIAVADSLFNVLIDLL